MNEDSVKRVLDSAPPLPLLDPSLPTEAYVCNAGQTRQLRSFGLRVTGGSVNQSNIKTSIQQKGTWYQGNGHTRTEPTHAADHCRRKAVKA